MAGREESCKIKFDCLFGEIEQCDCDEADEAVLRLANRCACIRAAYALVPASFCCRAPACWSVLDTAAGMHANFVSVHV